MNLSLCMKALGDSTRFAIFQQLLVRKHCTRSLSRQMGITEAAVSQHLKVLREAGLIYGEKYGYHKHYLPSPSAMEFLADAFEQMRQTAMNMSAAFQPCQCEFRELPEGTIPNIIEKETDTMRIAVTYENGEIFQHFGHTEQFKLYDVQNGTIIREQIVDTNGSGHGALAGFLKAAQAEALICGGIGMGARMALDEAGIQVYAGVQGKADEAALALAEERLDYDPNARCTHHEHHEGDCGHEHCEEHQCRGNE